ncbi:MAG: NUDIX domain-containing protein [Aureispira sp.]
MYKVEFDKLFSYSFSLDAVIFGYKDGEVNVLLIKRAMDPFFGEWAIPGDLIYPDEDMPVAANRILQDLTKLDNIDLHQVQTFGAPNRHPQGRVITCAYLALVKMDNINAEASSWADAVQWVPVHEVGKLAFDHNLIINSTFELLKQKLASHPVCFKLLPEKFTLNDMQQLYEYVFDVAMDKANFRKKIKSIPLIKHNERQQNVRHRPASLYSFDGEKYDKMVSEEHYTFKM